MNRLLTLQEAEDKSIFDIMKIHQKSHKNIGTLIGASKHIQFNFNALKLFSYNRKLVIDL